MGIAPSRTETLIDVLDRLLDKGVVINADILINLADVRLLEIKIRAALASFETAAKYGLQFPTGTNMNTEAWKKINEEKETCLQCHKKVPVGELIQNGCPWCGWIPANTPVIKKIFSKWQRKKEMIEEKAG